MKRIFKFIPAALAVVALSSCSNDDLFGSAEGNLSQKNTLKVTVQQINDGDITRAANLGDGNGMVWQDGDQITVYDDQLFIYDPYKYNATAKAFVLDEDEIELIDEVAYALFPTAYFAEDESTNWERATDRVWVKANIPANMKYGAPSDDANPTTAGNPYVTANGKTAYVSLLPMWGTASKNGETTEATMQYMTAIIKVTLTNAQDNVKYLYVRGFKDIAGTQYAQLNGDFKAYLSETGRTPLASTTLAATKTTPTKADNYIEVDISNINKATSIIYIPVPVGHYGKLQVWATNEKVTDPGNYGTTIAAADKIYDFIDKDFEVKFYGSLTKKEYNVEVGTVAAINKLLQANKDEAKDNLVLNGANGSATVATATTDDVIALPQMAAGTVELKLKDITGAPVTISGDDFSKKFILNLTSTAQAITINLPKADVVLAGNFNSKNVTIENAKSLTFGDGVAAVTPATNPTTKDFGTIDIKAEVQGNIVVEQYAQVSALLLPTNHRATGITVNAKGEAGNISVNASELATATSVNVAGKAGNITTPADASTVTVSGEADAITMGGTGKATVSGMATSISNKAGGVEISGAPYFDITSDKYAKVNGDVTTEGDVTVALTGEGAAISGSLTMPRGKTLTLTQGYIMTIANPTGTTGNLTVNLNTSAAYLAIHTVPAANVVVTGTTKWNGKGFGGSVTKTTKDATGTEIGEAGVTELAGAWAGYADASSAVYTAMGLLANNDAFTLKNNIDLNDQPWTPAATTTGDINGSGKTIKNLTVAVPADGAAAAAATAGLGLFSDLKNNVTNLVLDGVTINAAQYTTSSTKHVVDNIGALAGKVSVADKTITAVTVKNVNLSSTGGAKAIGGIIGTNSEATTLSGVILTGTNTIKGYYQMGGLVGYAGANVTISTKAKATAPETPADVVCAATASFKANYNSATTTPALDKNYLSVGNFIGAAVKTAEINITCAAADVKGTKTVDTSIFPGYTKHNEGVNFYDYVFGQSLIGWSGDDVFTTAPKINTKDYQLSAVKPNPVPSEYLYYINK